MELYHFFMTLFHKWNSEGKEVTVINPHLENFKLFCKAMHYFRKVKMNILRHFRTKSLLPNRLILH